MLSLISVLVGMAMVTPTPEDFNLSRELLLPNNEFKLLHNVIPVKKIIYGFQEYQYENWEPSWKYERLRNAFIEVCTELEISNGKEWGYDNIVEFRDRLKSYHNYPNPEKFNFGITNYQINQNRLFAIKYRDYLEKRIKIGLENNREEILKLAYKETNELYIFWDSMSDAAQSQSYSINFAQRKNALIRVYEYLGEDDFYNGVYPPPVPIWRFNEYDK